MPSVHFYPCHFVRGFTAALLGAFGLAGALAAPGGPGTSAPAATAAAAEPAYWPPETGRELLAVDEPMRRFFSTRVDPRNTEGERLRQIVEALVRPEGLNFAYESDGLYDAREAFRRRRGTCVSFALLVVAVAREYGLDVQFQEFDTLQRWNRFDRFLASLRHTNVLMATDSMVFVVDLRSDFGPPERISDTRYVVPDERAFAHFYSTAGFFRLADGDTAGALRLMNLGVQCDPKSQIAWANLGNVHAQTGGLVRARTCFEKSLRLDSRGELALVSLVDVLRRQGGPEDLKRADKFERRAQALRLRNPYFHYHLAGQAQQAGDWAVVESHLRQAIRLKDDEPMFQEMMVQTLRLLGRSADAQRVEARLAKLRARLASAASPVVR